MWELARVAEAAGDGELGRGGDDARPRHPARVDLVADHDVHAGLAGGGADQGGEAVVVEDLRVAHGDERVLLGRRVAERVEARPLLGVADVGVAVDEARHERRPAAVHHLRAVPFDPLPALGHLLDAVALDQDLAPVGPLAGAVEYRDVGEQRLRHSRPLSPARPAAHGERLFDLFLLLPAPVSPAPPCGGGHTKPRLPADCTDTRRMHLGRSAQHRAYPLRTETLRAFVAPASFQARATHHGAVGGGSRVRQHRAMSRANSHAATSSTRLRRALDSARLPARPIPHAFGATVAGPFGNSAAVLPYLTLSRFVSLYLALSRNILGILAKKSALPNRDTPHGGAVSS